MKDNRTLQECEACIKNMIKEQRLVCASDLPADMAIEAYDDIDSIIRKAERRIKKLKKGMLSFPASDGGELMIKE